MAESAEESMQVVEPRTGLAVAVRATIKRDLTLMLRRRGEVINPLVFFALVITLFPLGISPDTALLAEIAPGLLWVAALLATQLSLDVLFRSDFDDGSLEQLLLAPQPLPVLVLSKVLVHWLVSFVPLLILSPLLALFLNLTVQMYTALMLTLLLGTPLLSLVGAIAVGLTVGLQRGGVLLALLLIPVFIPLLIFATSAVDAAALQLPYRAHLAIIGAMLLAAMAAAPMAIAYALKVSQN